MPWRSPRGRPSDRGSRNLAHHFGRPSGFGGSERSSTTDLLAARSQRGPAAYDDAACELSLALEIGIRLGPCAAEPLLSSARHGHREERRPMRWMPLRSRRISPRSLCSAAACSPCGRSAHRSMRAPARDRALDSVELLLRCARAACYESDELRIGLFGRLARALDSSGDRERGSDCRENAVARLARRREDRADACEIGFPLVWARGTTPLEETLPLMVDRGKVPARSLGGLRDPHLCDVWRVRPSSRAAATRFRPARGCLQLRFPSGRHPGAAVLWNHCPSTTGRESALLRRNPARKPSMASRSH